MKYLIAGLGNIGEEYARTRHNAGFQVVDHLADKLGASWKNVTLGQLAEAKYKGRTLLLLKPNTYMNLSGKSIAYWMQKEKIPMENLLVILDEIQLEPGTIRLRGKGSDGGHNGLRDIQAQLNSIDYTRLRIGVGKNFHPGKQVDFVLGEWSADEKKIFPEIMEKAAEAIQLFVSIGLKRSMETVNATAKKSDEKKSDEKKSKS